MPGRRPRGADAARPHGGPKSNLPHPTSGIVGRAGDIVEVASLLGRFRLVTVTGPGGMGKTRLALEVAARAGFRYPDGVWLVELEGITDCAHLPEAVAGALPAEHRLGPRAPGDVALQIGRRHLLLVLDGCEHQVGSCALLVERLLRSCPSLDVLTTSRQPLGIVGEHSWAVGPLSLPVDEVDAASLASTESGELFLQRATEVKPQFRLTDASAGTVAEICRRLDGMPLAIELAARRVTSLAPADILQRLDDRFRLLTSGGSSVAPARHQTLLGTLEASHDLLMEAEAVLLRRLGVFTGWSLRAAEEVCSGEPVDELDVVDLLAGLVNKSLVVADELEGRIRYRLLETVQAWAQTKLGASGEAGGVRRAHAMWCVRLAEDADEELRGRHPKPFLDDLNVEHDNLRVALEWARAAGEVEIGVRLVTALAQYWRLSGHLEEGERWMGWAVVASADAPATLRAKALRADAAWAEGAALPVEEAVAYARRGRRGRDRPVTGWDSLTSAEKEVVRLVVQGLSNPEVGRRLFISPRTVGHHLTHVFDKVGIRSRGALAQALAGHDL